MKLEEMLEIVVAFALVALIVWAILAMLFIALAPKGRVI